jgi:hypothetical protein
MEASRAVMRVITDIRAIIIREAKTRIPPTQSGAVIHHQDQSIFPVSFRVRKTKNRRINTDPPHPEEEELEDITYSRIDFSLDLDANSL